MGLVMVQTQFYNFFLQQSGEQLSDTFESCRGEPPKSPKRMAILKRLLQLSVHPMLVFEEIKRIVSSEYQHVMCFCAVG